MSDLLYYIVPADRFDAWKSATKEKYPSPVRSCADGGSEIVLSVYAGPIALTAGERGEIESLGGVLMTEDELKMYRTDYPEKWVVTGD